MALDNPPPGVWGMNMMDSVLKSAGRGVVGGGGVWVWGDGLEVGTGVGVVLSWLYCPGYLSGEGLCAGHQGAGVL